METPKFVTSWSEVWVAWGSHLQLASAVKASLVQGTDSLIYGVCTNWVVSATIEL